MTQNVQKSQVLGRTEDQRINFFFFFNSRGVPGDPEDMITSVRLIVKLKRRVKENVSRLHVSVI